MQMEALGLGSGKKISDHTSRVLRKYEEQLCVNTFIRDDVCLFVCLFAVEAMGVAQHHDAVS